MVSPLFWLGRFPSTIADPLVVDDVEEKCVATGALWTPDVPPTEEDPPTRVVPTEVSPPIEEELPPVEVVPPLAEDPPIELVPPEVVVSLVVPPTEEEPPTEDVPPVEVAPPDPLEALFISWKLLIYTVLQDLLAFSSRDTPVTRLEEATPKAEKGI